MEDTWRFLKKLKVELPYDSVIPSSGYISKGNKTGISKTYLYFHVQFSIHNSWDMEKSKFPLSQTDKENVTSVCVYNWILLFTLKRRKSCHLWQRGYAWRTLKVKYARCTKTNTTWSHLYIESIKVKPRKITMITRCLGVGRKRAVLAKGANFEF